MDKGIRAGVDKILVPVVVLKAVSKADMPVTPLNLVSNPKFKPGLGVTAFGLMTPGLRIVGIFCDKPTMLEPGLPVVLVKLVPPNAVF